MAGIGRSIRLPDGVGATLADIRAGGREVVEPRDSATVLLLRTAAGPAEPTGASGSFEVYLLRRSPTMAFAPGAHVFPGGSVDPRDTELAPGWAGPTRDRWARALDTTPELAQALVCAAIRETFEESGVLLAGHTARQIVADTGGDGWEADRCALVDHSLSLAELCARRGLVLRSDLLRVWSRWVTPEVQPRRYDTRFFVAALPAGQRTRDVGGEADGVTWLRPRKALDAAETGAMLLWPPTETTLGELARYPDVAAVLAASAARPAARRPYAVEVAGEVRLVLPEAPPAGC